MFRVLLLVLSRPAHTNVIPLISFPISFQSASKRVDCEQGVKRRTQLHWKLKVFALTLHFTARKSLVIRLLCITSGRLCQFLSRNKCGYVLHPGPHVTGIAQSEGTRLMPAKCCADLIVSILVFPSPPLYPASISSPIHHASFALF